MRFRQCDNLKQYIHYIMITVLKCIILKYMRKEQTPFSTEQNLLYLYTTYRKYGTFSKVNYYYFYFNYSFILYCTQSHITGKKIVVLKPWLFWIVVYFETSIQSMTNLQWACYQLQFAWLCRMATNWGSLRKATGKHNNMLITWHVGVMENWCSGKKKKNM